MEFIDIHDQMTVEEYGKICNCPKLKQRAEAVAHYNSYEALWLLYQTVRDVAYENDTNILSAGLQSRSYVLCLLEMAIRMRAGIDAAELVTSAIGNYKEYLEASKL
jgi:hypothetical protein